MKCTEVRSSLPLLIYAELEPKEEAALRDHLVHCADCRREQQALAEVRRVLDAAPVPHVEVDLPQLYQTRVARQTRSLRRWRRIALVVGALAALLLLTVGLRLEIRWGSGQLVVRWGDSPPSIPAPAPPQTIVAKAVLSPETEAELRVLSELIHALKQDVDGLDERVQERLVHLQRQVQVLQAQADQRWNTTEQDVAALYLLTRKGEKP